MSNELVVTYHNGDREVVSMPTLNALEEFEQAFIREEFAILKAENITTREPVLIFLSGVRSIR